MTPTSRSGLGQDDISDLESAVGLVTSPGVRDVGKVALSTLLPKGPSPGRPGEIAGGEGLAPLVVSREVVAAGNESRTVGVGGRIDKPAVPVRSIVESPAIWLRVTDISDVGVVPGAGCCVLRYSHFDLSSIRPLGEIPTNYFVVSAIDFLQTRQGDGSAAHKCSQAIVLTRIESHDTLFVKSG